MKIPFVAAKEQLPGVGALVPQDPAAMAVKETAMLRSGQQSMQNAEHLTYVATAYDEHQRKAAQALQLSNLTVGAARELFDLREGFSKRKDYQNFPDEARAGIAAIIEKYKGQVADNEVWGAFLPRFQHEALKTELEIKHEGNKIFIDEGRGRLYADMEELARLRAFARDDLEMQGVDAKAEMVLSGAKASGFISNTEHATWRQKYLENVDSIQAERDMEADPDTFSAKINDAANYPNIEPQKRIQLFRNSLHEARARRLEAKEQEREAQDENLGRILTERLTKQAKGGVFTFQDLKRLAYDKAGNLAISTQALHMMEQNIKSDIQHRESMGRRQPDMNEDRWRQYAELVTKIDRGTGTLEDIARVSGRFPDSITANLMHMTRGKQSEMEKMYASDVHAYVNKLAPMTSVASWGQMRNDIDAMMRNSGITPDKWMSKAQEIAAERMKTGISDKLNERLYYLNSPTTGLTAPAAPQQLKGQRTGTDSATGRKVYQGIDGVTRFADTNEVVQ